jgi:hypothetical protein
MSVFVFTLYITRCLLNLILHLITHFVEPAHKMYQYSLTMALWGLRHLSEWHIVNNVMLIINVRISWIFVWIPVILLYGQEQVKFIFTQLPSAPLMRNSAPVLKSNCHKS